MKPVIEVEHLRKTYGTTVAVDDVSFDVADGEIFGLLGRNGAGKTTTVECLQGSWQPEAERVLNAVEHKFGPFRAAEIEVECPGVSHERVRRILRELRDEGMIEFRGRGPGARWVKKRPGDSTKPT